MFAASLLMIAFLYGVAVGRYEIFPYQLLRLAGEGIDELMLVTGIKDGLPWYYRRVGADYPKGMHVADRAFQGINLVTRLDADDRIVAEILDMEGRLLHEWDVDWFRIWPDAQHLPPHAVPKSAPGTHLHGAQVLPDGGLIYNYDHLGLVRLTREGDVVWRLAYQTDHSIHLDDDGNLWVCGQRERTEPDADYPGRELPYDEYTILKISPDGRILEEWSLPKILDQNGYAGLLYLGSARPHPISRDDRLHLNDVETFPRDTQSGFFEQGDVMVSMRNINTILVFGQQDRRIKFIDTGRYVAQHDPDFQDGNRFTVLDNNFRPGDATPHSRILSVDAASNTLEVLYRGTAEEPFFTSFLGKHQVLPNGNLLISESAKGRAFEIDSRGEIVWQWVNYIDDGMIGAVEEVSRLPLSYRSLFTLDNGLQNRE